jgi:hypothetical protein
MTESCADTSLNYKQNQDPNLWGFDIVYNDDVNKTKKENDKEISFARQESGNVAVATIVFRCC